MYYLCLCVTLTGGESVGQRFCLSFLIEGKDGDGVLRHRAQVAQHHRGYRTHFHLRSTKGQRSETCQKKTVHSDRLHAHLIGLHSVRLHINNTVTFDLTRWRVPRQFSRAVIYV